MAHNHSLWPAVASFCFSIEKPVLAHCQAASQGRCSELDLNCHTPIVLQRVNWNQNISSPSDSSDDLLLRFYLLAERPARPRGSVGAHQSRRRSGGPSCWSSASAGWGPHRARGGAERSRPPSPRHLGDTRVMCVDAQGTTS